MYVHTLIISKDYLGGKNMSILHAIILGIVQGIAEFLPISSSGHLVAIPKIFGFYDGGLAFDAALHLGTLVAVIAFFWKDWIELISAGLTKPKSKNGKLFWYIVIATIPGAVFGKLFEKQAEDAFRSILLIGIMMIVMGIVLYAADKMGRNRENVEDIGLVQSFIIGLSQALAIIPGVSRSGITMSAGLLSGLDKESAARFSFLLSTPIVFGAGILKLKDLINPPAKAVAIGAAPVAVGIITSAIVGIISIKFLLDYLKKKGFGVFVVYRFIAGAALIAMFCLGVR